MLQVQNSRKTLILSVLLVFTLPVWAQVSKTYILELEQGTPPAKLANYQFVIVETGEEGITDSEGKALVYLQANMTYHLLLVNGQAGRDTLMITTNDSFISLVNYRVYSGKTINITVKQEGYGQLRGVQKAYNIGETEIKKAACCTLSECFENSNSVEIANADGVSGIKQVEMLGLPGKYVLMTSANIYNVKIWNQLNGFSQTPGPLVENISVSKGVGSVTNSYGGITGGIDYQLKSYETSPKLFFNSYANSQQRFENNLFVKFKPGAKWHNLTYLHHALQTRVMDYNKDGFTDMPLLQRWFAGQAYSYSGNKAEIKINWNYVQENRYAGNLDNNKILFGQPHYPDSSHYVFMQKTKRLEASTKIGVFINRQRNTSWGNILSAYAQSDSLVFGIANNIYAKGAGVGYNGIYSDEISKKLSVRAGVQLNYDGVEEHIKKNSSQFPKRQFEFTQGIYAEFNYARRYLTAVMGLRVDHSNIYDYFFTPRLHVKYSRHSNSTLFLQAGRGRKSPWVWSEIYPLLNSGKTVRFLTSSIAGGLYGLGQEIAWSGGAGWVKKGVFLGKITTLSLDGNITYFDKMLVTDRDESPTELRISMQSGIVNYATQEDLTMLLHKRVSFTLSHRYVFNQQTLAAQKLLQPLYSPHRFLFSAGLKNRKLWTLDLLCQVNSPKRIPNGSENPQTKELNNFSPWYAILNGQLSKKVKKSLELYSGVENILNVRQHNLVRNAGAVTSPYFDTTAVWGPTYGRTVYLGLRFRVNDK